LNTGSYCWNTGSSTAIGTSGKRRVLRKSPIGMRAETMSSWWFDELASRVPRGSMIAVPPSCAPAASAKPMLFGVTELPMPMQ
jgi:hypothetical protein